MSQQCMFLLPEELISRMKDFWSSGEGYVKGVKDDFHAVSRINKGLWRGEGVYAKRTKEKK